MAADRGSHPPTPPIHVENLERLKQDNAQLQQAMVDMSDGHTQEILAYMQSAQSAAQTKKGSGWF